jgi:hypothetical protein
MSGTLLLMEDIAKSAQQAFHGGRAGITGDHLTVQKIKTSQVIDTIDMVGMGMGKQHRINLRYHLTQHLAAQIS